MKKKKGTSLCICWVSALAAAGYFDCAFLLVKSCPLRKCVSSGTLAPSVPARALPLGLPVIDYCAKGSADAVVTQNNGELVSAVREDALPGICLR